MSRPRNLPCRGCGGPKGPKNKFYCGAPCEASSASQKQKDYRARHPERCRERLYAYRRRNKDKIAAIQRRSAWKHPERRLLQLCRARARKAGLLCTVTKEDIVVPSHCPVLGLPLFVQKRGFSDNSPTLDRIDNTKGYVPGNVMVVSWRANRIKCDATVAELCMLASFYATRVPA